MEGLLSTGPTPSSFLADQCFRVKSGTALMIRGVIRKQPTCDEILEDQPPQKKNYGRLVAYQ